MKYERAVTAKQILEYLKSINIVVTYSGDETVIVSGFSSLGYYREGNITWIKKDDNVPPNLDLSKINLVIIQEGVQASCKNTIITTESKRAFFAILEQFFTDTSKQPPIGSYTVIGKNVILEENVIIGHNCVLEGNIRIGKNTSIGNNCVIVNDVKIGQNCKIQSQVVIGEDGFGCSEDEKHKKHMIRHYGGVKIGEDVFIASHVNIARGTIDDTIIESGVKIAPSTHIGHNNYIGEDSVIICSNLFGTVHTGKNAYIVASTIRNQCSIGENTVVGMGSIVTKDVGANQIVIGSPAKPMKTV